MGMRGQIDEGVRQSAVEVVTRASRSSMPRPTRMVFEGDDCLSLQYRVGLVYNTLIRISKAGVDVWPRGG